MANPYSQKNPYGGIVEIPSEVALDPELFNQFTAHHGIRVTIEKTVVCPNYRGNIKQNYHDPNCTMCDNGFITYDSFDCFALFQQNALQKTYIERGEFSMGQAIITVPSVDESGRDIVVGLYDRITLLDQFERFYEAKNKGPAETDLLRYKAVSIEYVTTASRGIANPFINGTDYELDVNNNIHWIASKDRPSFNPDTGLGEIFVVSYIFRPIYRVLQMLHEGRYSSRASSLGKVTTRFPQTLMVRKDYYVTKEDIDGVRFKEPVVDQRDAGDPDEPESGAF